MAGVSWKVCIVFALFATVIDCLSVTDSATHQEHCHEAENVRCYRTKESVADIKKKVTMLRYDCGDVCDTTVKGEKYSKPGKFLKAIKKKIDCPTILSSPVFDGELLMGPECVNFPPTFCDIPESVVQEYLFGGRVPAKLSYMVDSYSYPIFKKKEDEEDDTEWQVDAIDGFLRDMFRQGLMEGGYGVETVKRISDAIDTHMADKVSQAQNCVYHSCLELFGWLFPQ